MQNETKLAILVNVIAPYRIPVYEKIGQQFESFVFYSGEEHNRAAWQGIEDSLQCLAVKRSWGITFRLLLGQSSEVYDYKFVHITPGYVFDLLKVRPHAVLTSEMGFRTLLALLYGTLYRKSVWVWWGGTLRTERNIGFIKKVLRRIVAQWAKRWISYGETSTEYLLSLGVPRERILQIQNCVDERVFLQSTKPAMQLEPKPVLLYVGQLIRRKGLDKLLGTAAQLQREGHRFSLLLVGDGPEKAALEAFAKEIDLQNTHFHPAQPPEAMPAIYRSANCLVFPTLEDNWGLVVNEALWSGIPVLSSLHAGCAKELLPSENLFDPLEEASRAAALKRALEGKIASPDLSRLKTHAEVANMIIRDIEGALRV